MVKMSRNKATDSKYQARTIEEKIKALKEVDRGEKYWAIYNHHALTGI